MPDARSESEIKTRWQAFVRSLRSLFEGLPEHRHQDQFLRVKEAALTLAESQRMADEVWGGYRDAVLADNQPTPGADAVEAVVLELEAFPLAVQVYEAEQKASTVKPGANKQLRLAAKTILGSVDNLFRLPDFSKGVIAVLGEALDLLGSN